MRKKTAKRTNYEGNLDSFIEKLHQEDATPLHFLVGVYRDDTREIGIRVEAAKSAMPYIHRKLPVLVNTMGQLQVIPPYVPSKALLREEYANEEGRDL